MHRHKYCCVMRVETQVNASADMRMTFLFSWTLVIVLILSYVPLQGIEDVKTLISCKYTNVIFVVSNFYSIRTECRKLICSIRFKFKVFQSIKWHSKQNVSYFNISRQQNRKISYQDQILTLHNKKINKKPLHFT